MLRSLFIDFNSYFASVEQQLDPALRGRPVGMVPVIADSSSCIAASIEAKVFGVKTGTRLADAKRMCPGIDLVWPTTPNMCRRMNRRWPWWTGWPRCARW